MVFTFSTFQLLILRSFSSSMQFSPVLVTQSCVISPGIVAFTKQIFMSGWSFRYHPGLHAPTHSFNLSNNSVLDFASKLTPQTPQAIKTTAAIQRRSALAWARTRLRRRARISRRMMVRDPAPCAARVLMTHRQGIDLGISRRKRRYLRNGRREHGSPRTTRRAK